MLDREGTLPDCLYSFFIEVIPVSYIKYTVSMITEASRGKA